MPFYGFQIEVDVPPPVVIERLRSIVRDQPTFLESLRKMRAFGSLGGAPFIGTVQDESFKIRRDIRYRNSFLPMIWGRVRPNGVGTRLYVTMFIPPFAAFLMILWLGRVGFGAVSARSVSSMIPAGMFIFGVALILGAFIPEAIKAKRFISEPVASSTVRSLQETAANR